MDSYFLFHPEMIPLFSNSEESRRIFQLLKENNVEYIFDEDNDIDDNDDYNDNGGKDDYGNVFFLSFSLAYAVVHNL